MTRSLTQPTVLLVAYYFPPRGGVAAQRAVKIAKYLTDFGWRPVVLTCSSVPEEMLDEALLAEIPSEAQVVRAPMVGFDRLQTLARRRLGLALSRQVVKRRKRRPSVRARARWLLVPDDKIGWLPAAVWHGMRLIRRHRVSAIFSAYPPATAHLVAWWLSVLSGRPWMAEFQDPYSANEGLYFPSRAHWYLAGALERAVVGKASTVGATTEMLTETLRHAHGHHPPPFFVTVPNGFDPEEFAAAQRHSPPHIFTMVHAGSFRSFAEDRRRSPVYFLRALRAWMDSEPERRRDVRVELLGTMEAYLRAIVEAQGLGDVVHVGGFVSHRAAVEHIVAADVLVVIMGEDERTTIAAKLYEYLAARRPILALVPEGPAAQLVRATGSGIVVPPGDPDQILQAMRNLYAKRLGSDAPPIALAGMTWRESVRRLAEHLRRITGAPAAEPVKREVALDR